MSRLAYPPPPPPRIRLAGIARADWLRHTYLRYLAGAITADQLIAAVHQVQPPNHPASVNACHPQAIVVIVETDRPD